MRQEFYSKPDLAEYFGLSPKTVSRIEKEMRKQIGKIYSANDFTNHPIRIRLSAFQSHLNRRTAIASGAKVEPFRPGNIA